MPQYFILSFASVCVSVQEKKRQNRFSRWRLSRISDRNYFSYFRSSIYRSPRCFLPSSARHRCSIWNLTSIGSVASEKKMYFNVWMDDSLKAGADKLNGVGRGGGGRDIANREKLSLYQFVVRSQKHLFELLIYEYIYIYIIYIYIYIYILYIYIIYIYIYIYIYI